MIKYLLFLALAFSAFATEKIKDNALKVGKEDSQDVYIYANEGSANPPHFLFDFSEGNWRVSNDGTTLLDLVYDTTDQVIAGVKNFSSELLLDQIATPSTPAAGKNKIYTKSDDKLYILASDGSEKKIGTGGGSAGINFVSDDSFEDGTLDPDSDGGGTELYQTYTTDAELYSEFNEIYFRASYTSLSAADTYVRDSFARTGLDDKQGLFSIWAKVDGDGFDLCVRTDDASFATACDTALTISIVGDDTWRKYEIPFVFGASTVEYEIRNSSYTGNVDIEIDKVYVGTPPDGYFPEPLAITDWQDFPSNAAGTLITATTSNPVYGTVSNNQARWRRVGDSMEIEWDFSQTAVGTDGSGVYLFNLPSGYQIDTSQKPANTDIVYTNTTLMADSAVGEIHHTFASGASSSQAWGSAVVYSDTQLKFTNAYTTASSVADADYWSGSLYGFGSVAPMSIHLRAKVPIQGWSSQTTNIVTQQGNFLDTSFKGTASSNQNTITSGVATKVNIDTVAFDPSESYDETTNYRYTAKEKGKYLVKGAAAWGSAGVDFRIQSFIRKNGSSFYTEQHSTNTAGNSIAPVSGIVDLDVGDYVELWTQQDSGSAKNIVAGSFFTIQKIPTTETIVGKFANINSSDLNHVDFSGAGAQTISDGNSEKVSLQTLQVNTGNLSTTGNRVTIGKDGKYAVGGAVGFSAAASGQRTRCGVRKNGAGSAVNLALGYTAGNADGAGNCKIPLKNVELVEGDTLELFFWNDTGVTQKIDTSTALTYLTVIDLPDTQSIIENLVEDQVTECQTKYLSSDSTTTADIITFSGLTIGKKYELSAQVQMNKTTNGSPNVVLQENSNTVGGATMSSANAEALQNYHPSAKFTATGTTAKLVHNAAGTSTIFGNGGAFETYATLCELPDSTILNSTKFD